MPTERTPERAAELGDDFAAANAAVIAFASDCSDAQWRTVVPGEEWTVGVVLHHIAEGHAQVLQWVEAMVRGDGVTDTTDDIHQRNREHAARCTEVDRAETVALLEANGARTEAALRRLTDEQLDRTAPFGPADGRPFPVAEMAAAVAGHPRGHLAHAMAAVQGVS